VPSPLKDGRLGTMPRKVEEADVFRKQGVDKPTRRPQEVIDVTVEDESAFEAHAQEGGPHVHRLHH